MKTALTAVAGLAALLVALPLLAFTSSPAPPACPTAGIADAGNLGAFLGAVRQHESGGDYTAANPGSSASGAYQMLDSTFQAEAKAAGTGAQYPRAMNAPPAVQDAVAAYMATNAFNGPAHGDWLRVADVWYIGKVAAPAELDVVPNGGNSITPRQYEQAIAKLMGGPAPQVCAGTLLAVSPGVAGYTSPFGPGQWAPARTDQGVDEIPLVPSALVAIGPGIVVYSNINSGWPGGAFLGIRLTAGPKAGLVYYTAEHLTNLASVGTVVAAGQQIATALPGWPFTEQGWASPQGDSPAATAAYNGAADGTATPGGKAFARLLIELGVTVQQDPGAGSDTP